MILEGEFDWFKEWLLEWGDVFQNLHYLFKTFELPRLEAVFRDILKYYKAGEVDGLFKAVVGLFVILGEYGLLFGGFFIEEVSQHIIELIKHIIGH